MQQNNTHAFTETLQEINKFLVDPKNRDLLDAEMTLVFQRKIKEISNYIDQKSKEGRKLSIGIMGAMKAGKSSFLNALLFDGEDILPKAATPMTASLTVLSYAPQSCAHITFFSKEEWQMIETECNRLDQEVQRILSEEQQDNNPNRNKKFLLMNNVAPKKKRIKRTPEEILKDLLMQNDTIRSYYEVRELVRKNHLNPNEYLDQIEHIKDQADWRKLLESLNEYVGADGKFTPLVNYITLELNNEMLKNLEIVDTPGLNDPFTSRSIETKNFLSKCDVVLYVCQVSQFITKQDVDFICQDMSENATADAYIIGSQIDSGVLQYSSTEHSFIKAYNSSIDVYNRQAQNILSKQQHNPIAKKILDKLPPKYISALMFSVAQKKLRHQPLNDAENNILTQMQRQFTDIDQAFKEAKDYFDLAGINEVKTDILDQIRLHKQELIAERNSKYITTSNQVLLEILSKLSQNLSFKLQDLKDENHDPRKKLQEMQNRMNDASYDIANTIREYTIYLKQQTQEVKNEVVRVMQHYNHINISTQTETSSTTESGWFSQTTTTTTTTHHYADVAAAISKIVQYERAAQSIINVQIKNINSRKVLISQIREKFKNVFDMSDSNFKPQEIINMIDTCLSNFEVIEINQNLSDVARLDIIKKYPFKVADEETYELNFCVESHINNIQKALWKELDARLLQMNNFLNEQSVKLCDKVKDKIKQNCEQIERMTKDRETYIQNIEQLILQIKQFQHDLVN